MLQFVVAYLAVMIHRESFALVAVHKVFTENANIGGIDKCEVKI